MEVICECMFYGGKLYTRCCPTIEAIYVLAATTMEVIRNCMFYDGKLYTRCCPTKEAIRTRRHNDGSDTRVPVQRWEVIHALLFYNGSNISTRRYNDGSDMRVHVLRWEVIHALLSYN